MAKASDKRTQRDVPQLTPDAIAAAAWALVDADGLGALSTRALASALGVKQPALYWHLRDKAELLALMMEHLLRDSLADAPAGLAWPDWLRFVAGRQRAALLARRDSAQLASRAPPSERLRTDLFPRIMAPLVAAGATPAQASAAAGGLAAFVLGWVLYEQRPETRAFIETFHEAERGFVLALDYFVQGLATTLDRSPPTP